MPRQNKTRKRRRSKLASGAGAATAAAAPAPDLDTLRDLAARVAALSGHAPETGADGAPIKRVAINDYYKPFPRQHEFHTSPAKYRLFGGAAGPGKTKALLWEAIRQANKHPKVDTLLLRRTFPELESSLISYFRRDVPRDLYRSYNDSKHIVTWNNGSTTRFGYSAGENDIYQYQGAEFLFIGVDELTLFTLGQWQFLTSRNRCSVPGTRPNMAGATNPGNVGHAWVKALWVDKRPAPGMDRADQYDPRDYDFIRATLDDNPIYKDDARYRKTLEALPRHMRQAFLLGDWNVFAGQYFDVFSEKCLCRTERLGIESWWLRWISIDWGFEHPSAVYWHAARPAGGVATYREFVANHLSPRMLAQAIAERSIGFASCSSGRPPFSGGRLGAVSDSPGSACESLAINRGLCHSESAAADEESLCMHGRPREESAGISTPEAFPARRSAYSYAPSPERITEVFLSPDAFAHRTSDSSIAEQLGDVLAASGLPRPVPADDDRVGGWMLMYQMMEEGKWTIADSCTHLIECIPTLVRDPANVEDVQKMSGDDPADSARYGLKSRLSPGRQPPEQRIAQKLDSAGALDPTSRAIWTQKFMHEARRSGRPAHLPSRWAGR